MYFEHIPDSLEHIHEKTADFKPFNKHVSQFETLK